MWIEEWMYVCVDRGMDGWRGGYRNNGWIEEWLVGCLDGWREGWMDGWIDGCMDE